MIRHREYTRARLAQVSERLRALIHAKTRPLDERSTSEVGDAVAARV